MSTSRDDRVRPRRSLQEIWRQGPSSPFPESFAPASGPYRPGSLGDEDLRRLRIPEARDPKTRDDTPSLAGGSPSPGGPWGPATTDQATANQPPATPFDEAAYQSQIQDLLRKGYSLPPEFGSLIKGIAESAGKILHCMKTDPADVQEGDRFLARYLKATLNLLDTFHRLVETDPDKERLAKVSAETLAMLERLEAAFRKEHADLLANDVRDLSADMKTIDKLLKMEGH